MLNKQELEKAIKKKEKSIFINILISFVILTSFFIYIQIDNNKIDNLCIKYNGTEFNEVYSIYDSNMKPIISFSGCGNENFECISKGGELYLHNNSNNITITCNLTKENGTLVENFMYNNLKEKMGFIKINVSKDVTSKIYYKNDKISKFYLYGLSNFLTYFLIIFLFYLTTKLTIYFTYFKLKKENDKIIIKEILNNYENKRFTLSWAIRAILYITKMWLILYFFLFSLINAQEFILSAWSMQFVIIFFSVCLILAKDYLNDNFVRKEKGDFNVKNKKRL